MSDSRSGAAESMTSPGKVEGPSALRARVLIPVTVVFVGIGAMFVWFGPKFLLQRWLPDGLTADDAQRSLLPATQSVLFVLGGLIAVVGVVVSLSRHRQEIAAAERDSARYDFDRLREDVRVREAELSRTAEAELGLRQRFVSAVDLLADRGSAIRRAAGLYAIASLADDWGTFGNRAEQQVCIDVLCGYLRSPQGNGQTAADEITVRQTGFEIIRAHLRSRGPNWAGCRFNLSGSRIDYVADLRNITVDPLGRLDFVGCRIEGDGQLLLQGLESTGVLNLRDVVLNVDLIQDSAPQPTLDLSRSRFDMAAVEMRGMKVLGRASVDFKKARIVGGTCMIGARLAELAEFNFRPSSVQQTHVRISVYMIDHSVVKLESTTYSEDAHLSLFGSAEDSAVLELGVGQATSRSATDENAALRLDNAHLRIGPFSFTDNSALDVRGIIVGLSSSFDSRRVSARAQAVLSLTGVAGSGEAFLPVPEN